MNQNELFGLVEPVKLDKTKFKPNLKIPFTFKSSEQSQMYETAGQSEKISKIQQFLKIQSIENEQFKKAKYQQINSQRKQEKIFYQLQFTQGIQKHNKIFSKNNQSVDQFSRFPCDYHFYKNEDIQNQSTIKQKDKIYQEYQIQTKQKSKSMWNQNSTQKNSILSFDANLQKKNQLKEQTQTQKTLKISNNNNEFIDKYIKNDVNKNWKVKTNINETFNLLEVDYQLYPRQSVQIKKKPFSYKTQLGCFDKQIFLQKLDNDKINFYPKYKQFDSLKCNDFDYEPEYDYR